MKISNQKLCKCGCGADIVFKPHHRYTGIPDFIKGHSSRMPGHFMPVHNVKHTEQSKKKMAENHRPMDGANHPLFGKHHSIETKKKMSEKRMGMPGWNKGIYGVIKASEATKEKMSFAHSAERNHMFGKRGELAPGWKGGTSAIRDLVESSYQYQTWRKNVYKRDGFKCQMCGGGKTGKRGGYDDIHAHHLKTLARIIEENLNVLRNGDYSIPILSDIDNGITLCMDCHIQLHKERIAA